MMGCTPTIYYCADCGDAGAAIQLVNERGQIADEWYCWDCAMKHSTPIPEDAWGLRAVLALLDPLWVRSRAGATWLARRLGRALHKEDT
jgi:hypothetical protein